MKSLLHTGASLLLRVRYDNGDSKIVGFARNFSYSVSGGQKSTFVVDSPFPAEIAQSASPSQVRGTITVYLPKGSTPESAGLVPYRTDANGLNLAAGSRYMAFEVYDRLTSGLVAACEYCKVSNYSVSIAARGVVQVTLTFDGILLNPGNSI
jgi:hypothetical protein